MNGTLTPKLGDYRFSATYDTEVYVLVGGAPMWRAAQWENVNEFRSDTQDIRWVARPILAENEVLVETVDRAIEIVTKPSFRD
jgi:hypothetical protein